MPLRNRVVITVISVIAAICVIVPLIGNLIRAGNRQQVVITIPSAAANSPLPYSTPFPRTATTVIPKAGQSPAVQPSEITSSFSGFAPTIAKLKKPGDGTVDINTAPLQGLERLPGIGPAMASRILTERGSLGRFRKPSDLLEVRGIGPKKYAKMEPFVTIN